MNDFSSTIKFKNILPDYQAFLDFIVDYTMVPAISQLNAYLYKFLMNRFANSNIRYDSVDAFLSNFGITYEDGFCVMQARQKICDALYNLSADEIAVISENITNTALTDNSYLQNPLDQVANFSSEQVSSRDKGAKYLAYIDALEKMTNRFLDEFICDFSKHFARLFTRTDYFYDKEDN